MIRLELISISLVFVVKLKIMIFFAYQLYIALQMPQS